MSSPLSKAFNQSLSDLFLAKGQGTLTPKELLFSREAFLEKIHSSWLEELFATLSPTEKAFLSGALPPLAAKKMEAATTTPFPFLFRKNLAKRLNLYDHLPLPLLEKGPFSPLLELEKDSLVELISLLPLPLLSSQIKKIVDKKRLVAFYSLLHGEQIDLLKQTLLKPSQGTLLGFDLTTWKGSMSELEKTLHRFGILLLSQGLLGENPSFRFYISRILDTGRGKLFLEGSKEALAKDPKDLLFSVMKYHFNLRKKRGAS